MTKYLGDGSVVEFDSVDISGTYTDFEFAGSQPEPDTDDASDASSTEQELLTGLPKSPKTTATLAANDEVGGNTAITALAEGDTGDLVYYPEGKVHGKPMQTLAGATLSDINIKGTYKTHVVWNLKFWAYARVTRTTYSSAV